VKNEKRKDQSERGIVDREWRLEISIKRDTGRYRMKRTEVEDQKMQLN
jgi:hypothetical protein